MNGLPVPNKRNLNSALGRLRSRHHRMKLPTLFNNDVRRDKVAILGYWWPTVDSPLSVFAVEMLLKAQ